MSLLSDLRKAFDWDQQDLNRSVFAGEIDFLGSLVEHVGDYLVQTYGLGNKSAQRWGNVVQRLNQLVGAWAMEIQAEDVIRGSGGVLDDDQAIVFEPSFRGSTLNMGNNLQINDDDELELVVETIVTVAESIRDNAIDMPNRWYNHVADVTRLIYRASGL